MPGAQAYTSSLSISVRPPSGSAVPAAAFCCRLGFLRPPSTMRCLQRRRSGLKNEVIDRTLEWPPPSVLPVTTQRRTSEKIRMAEAARAVARRPEPNSNAATAPQSRMTELKVSAHLMMLETGLFAIFQPPGSPKAGANGLPGVRISLPPGPMRRPDAVRISTFREDGWMNGGDGALVRVAEGPAHVLVTIYQAPGAPPEAAPQL